jgi:hypothetical protein
MEEKEFFSLLGQFNELKKNENPETPILIAGRIPSFEPKKSDMLLNSLETIRSNYHFSGRREYIESAEDFLADEITAEEFLFDFMAIYEAIEQEVDQMERDESLELVNFLKPEKSMAISQSEIRNLLSKTYGTCDVFEPAISDEKELKECAQILILKLT